MKYIYLIFFLILISCKSNQFIIAEPWNVGPAYLIVHSTDTSKVVINSGNSNEIFYISGDVKGIEVGDSILINSNLEGEPTLLSTKDNKKTYEIVRYVNK